MRCLDKKLLSFHRPSKLCQHTSTTVWPGPRQLRKCYPSTLRACTTLFPRVTKSSTGVVRGTIDLLGTFAQADYAEWIPARNVVGLLRQDVGIVHKGWKLSIFWGCLLSRRARGGFMRLELLHSDMEPHTLRNVNQVGWR